VNSFQWPVRVYYEDTDSGGVVYYANYLKFFERARTELLRSKGFEQDQLCAETGVIFVVSEVHLKYRQPAKFNDALLVTAVVSELKKVGMVFQQEITRTDAPDQILCTATVRIACINAKNFRPTRIPAPIHKELMNEC
jgi:acyl-CoA thioester hydrolase